VTSNCLLQGASCQLAGVTSAIQIRFPQTLVRTAMSRLGQNFPLQSLLIEASALSVRGVVEPQTRLTSLP
jgi:hypothetical protein